MVRPVQPVMSRVVTLLGTVRLVRPEPDTFKVVTLAGTLRLVNFVQPEISSVPIAEPLGNAELCIEVKLTQFERLTEVRTVHPENAY